MYQNREERITWDCLEKFGLWNHDNLQLQFIQKHRKFAIYVELGLISQSIIPFIEKNRAHTRKRHS